MFLTSLCIKSLGICENSVAPDSHVLSSVKVRTASGECSSRTLGILVLSLLFSRLLIHHVTDDGDSYTERERHNEYRHEGGENKLTEW